MLLARKVEPRLAEVEIEVQKESLQVVAYPLVRSEYLSEIRKATHEPRKLFDLRRQMGGSNLTEAELFSLDPAQKQYTLSIHTEAMYVAEGRINFPGLARGSVFYHPFKVGSIEENGWFIAIKEGTYAFDSFYGLNSSKVLEQLLQQSTLYSPRNIPAIAELIAENIGKSLFPEVEPIPIVSHRGRLRHLFEQGRQQAQQQYQQQLEQKLKENPLQPLPAETYKFNIQGDQLVLAQNI